MASTLAVWGIDVGQCALKALRLQATPEGSLEVTHFDIIEHPKILSQPDAETDQLIANALDKFLSRNEIGKCRVAVSVPGQSSLARFVKLPPVEPKRIPEIVKFEAVQQIPFDIEEVEWDYQTFTSPTSPEVEVGIFAIRRELVLKHLSYLRAAGIEADIVQLAPLALYNMMAFDGQAAKTGATILIDVGAENTDLVISDGDRIWLRSIPLGGNNFTDALVKAFKLPFSKAENLKRTAATSKYARQIFVAMRPVFGDLVSEVQRSIGFYTALHRDAQMSRLVCLGNAFRLPGLQKYLEQNLSVESVRPNSFNRLKPSATINAPSFSENLWSFGVSYGLALQALDLAPISANLLPFSLARERNWRTQRPWFAAAAGAMVLGVAVAGWSAVNVKNHVEAEQAQSVSILSGPLTKARTIEKQKNDLRKLGAKEQEEIRDVERIPGYREVVPQVFALVQNAAPADWKEAASKAAAAAIAKEKKKTVLEVTFSEVWARIGTNEFQANPDNKVQLFLIDQITPELWVGKPPEAAAAGVPGGPGGVGVGPSGMTGGPAVGPGVAPVSPGGPGGTVGPGGPGGPNPQSPGVAASAGGAGAMAQAAGGDVSNRGYRITVIGYTNAPKDDLTLYRKYIDAINARLPKGPGAIVDKQLSQIRLVKELKVDETLKDTRLLTEPPKCWPPLESAAAATPPAGGAAAPPPGPPPAGGAPAATGAVALGYPITEFTLVFDVQVLPPMTVEQPPHP